LEKPVLGWGMNSARSMPGGKDKVVDKNGRMYGDQLPLHPHNAVLQIWLELGLPGAILFTALIALLISRMRDLPLTRSAMTLMVVQFLSVFMFSESSFGIWQSWWQAVLWINISLGILLYQRAIVPGTVGQAEADGPPPAEK
jgi:O-antigen ligase